LTSQWLATSQGQRITREGKKEKKKRKEKKKNKN